MPTIEEAIAPWLSARGFAPSTAAATHQHLESGRARGWRAQQGIVTIDQLSAEVAAAYLRYLRDRGAAPATLRKVKTLLASLAVFCAETPLRVPHAICFAPHRGDGSIGITSSG